MGIKEITAEELKSKVAMRNFIDIQTGAIRQAVGDGVAINALSGGVDSSVVTMLGRRAIGDGLKTYFINTGLMRENEPQEIEEIFRDLGVPIEIIDAKEIFLKALVGLTDPEKKRELGITQPFYQEVFARLARESDARVLLQGTNLTDVDETKAGIKRQHNVLKQLGIDPKKTFGYKIYEPVVHLRKDGIRLVAKALDLPDEIVNRQPFPGPGLAIRIGGEVTAEKLELVRRATAVTEEILNPLKPFQVMAILKNDRVTSIVNGKRCLGWQIEVRAWESKDALTAKPLRLLWNIIPELERRIRAAVPGVVSVDYHTTPKPPSTLEAF